MLISLGSGSLLDIFLGFLQHYRLFLLLFFSALCFFLLLLRFEKEIHVKWYGILLLSLTCQILGVLGTFIFAQFENLIRSGGSGVTSLFGSYLAIPLLLLVDSKVFHRDTRMMSDFYALGLLFGFFFARINCLISGCCKGIYLDAFGFEWPAREVELLFLIVLNIILTRRLMKKRFDGRNMPILMIGYGVFRFFNELLREGDAIIFGVFHISHIWCLLCICVGTVWLLILHQRVGKYPNNKEKKRKANA